MIICHYESGTLIRCEKNTVKKITARYCRHCGGDLHSPIEIEPGIFGKFFDGDKPVYRYDYLKSIDEVEQFPYIDMEGSYWEYFSAGLPSESIIIPDSD